MNDPLWIWQQPIRSAQCRLVEIGPRPASLRLLLNQARKSSSRSSYQAVAKVSKATATRHLEKGCLARLPTGGRSTRYRIQQPAHTLKADPAETKERTEVRDTIVPLRQVSLLSG